MTKINIEVEYEIIKINGRKSIENNIEIDNILKLISKLTIESNNIQIGLDIDKHEKR
jgi:hypothetical protein